jgi:peptidoglycan/xylan/chitin deacetylase (PgdA/CDA1 family)
MKPTDERLGGQEVALFAPNTPAAFWRLLIEPEPAPEVWASAVAAAAGLLPKGATAAGTDIGSLAVRVLGKGQFGPRHWRLSAGKRLYYELKPFLPRGLTRLLRRAHGGSTRPAFSLGWPIEGRYARFQWEVARQLLRLTERTECSFIDFWPEGHPYAFVLTHDVETADGQAFVSAVADLDARYGFRSSFNFVPERYHLDQRLLTELRERGFEIGVHGLRHDGKLFRSRAEFLRRAARINQYVRQLGAVGFRAPLTHRQPEWMQALEIEYDASFFDTDPYEPMPGGTMSLWPFAIGHFLELPYTLVQDYTLTAVLQQTTPRAWLEKVEFIRTYSGMALVLTHPDYLRSPGTWRIYEDFLRAMSARRDYWHALPRDVARWWRARTAATSITELPGAVRGTIRLSLDFPGEVARLPTAHTIASTSPAVAR